MQTNTLDMQTLTSVVSVRDRQTPPPGVGSRDPWVRSAPRTAGRALA